MRCPQCGFHSFDYLDNCKKCGIDLTACKQRLGLSGHLPTALPAVDTYAAPLPENISSAFEPDEPEEEEEIDFGFDILQEAAGASLESCGGFRAGGDDQSALPDNDLPTATVFANPENLDFDNPFTHDEGLPDGQPFPGINELDLNQPFSEELEQLPDDDLPKFGDRF